MIRRAIDMMYENYQHSLRTKDMADVAALSQFHFTRKFGRATGATPGNFLGAIRISQAKWLLQSTDLRVSDIMYQVGYGSIGTFTSKFTASVGMPPTLYRSAAVEVPTSPPTTPDAGTISGFLDVPDECSIRTVVVGVFSGPFARGRPQRIDVLTGPGPWRLAGVAPGEYHVIAVSSADCWDHESRKVLIRDPAAVGSIGPLRVPPSSLVRVRIELAPWRPARVPVLFPLPCVTAPCLGIHP